MRVTLGESQAHYQCRIVGQHLNYIISPKKVTIGFVKIVGYFYLHSCFVFLSLLYFATQGRLDFSRRTLCYVLQRSMTKKKQDRTKRQHSALIVVTNPFQLFRNLKKQFLTVIKLHHSSISYRIFSMKMKKTIQVHLIQTNRLFQWKTIKRKHAAYSHFFRSLPMIYVKQKPCVTPLLKDNERTYRIHCNLGWMRNYQGMNVLVEHSKYNLMFLMLLIFTNLDDKERSEQARTQWFIEVVGEWRWVCAVPPLIPTTQFVEDKKVRNMLALTDDAMLTLTFSFFVFCALISPSSYFLSFSRFLSLYIYRLPSSF